MNFLIIEIFLKDLIKLFSLIIKEPNLFLVKNKIKSNNVQEQRIARAM